MIDIVLATYNGEAFLAEQIESLQHSNGYDEWVNRIIVVDDGSTDATESIVKRFSLADKKISWVINDSGLHGASNNFTFGLSLTTAPYIMLCDQDDLWLPEKIQQSLDKIQTLEKQNGSMPLLVFTDKQIVDEKLQTICPSYFKLKNIPKNWHVKFANLCQQNVASGCTMLCNRALVDKAMPIPQQAYMHDWWLALVAHRCGKLELIDKPLIKYRQHNNNSIGANYRSKLNLFTQFNKHLNQFENSFLQTVEQAKAFAQFEKNNKLPSSKIVTTLVNIQSLTKSQKIKEIINKRVQRSHFIGRIALLIVLLKMKQKKN
ncbi:glycosyltransferase family 2 protein [Psychromonas hadalis]|uniref:glycosyltransferase family 2 protein n=1 Tax=Psychromonas hadalis TaxID=211669 RepID=UPI000417B99C|nr:glycosyltransferase family 2 protein [Psychromonas hadalis]